MTTGFVVPDTISGILPSLSCPDCHTGLLLSESLLTCASCDSTYPIVGEIPDLRPRVQRKMDYDENAWSHHWSEENQQTLPQKFFSFYRKAVFSRTVSFFANRYFPRSGILLEAGSGTSETSIRIDKCGGARKLVAADLVLPVLERCHPVMDARICGDIFNLPFRQDSLDGIWNVGVMEHFTHAQIDHVMRDFYRVLKPGGRLIMLWPGTDSIPQKILRSAEKIINLRKNQAEFRFHPDEISQLRSSDEGRDVLARSGFRILHIDYGLRSLMAFKTLVGEKN